MNAFTPDPPRATPEPQPVLHFLSFGSARQWGARVRLRAEAKRMGVFASIKVLGERDLGETFLRERGELIRRYPVGHGLRSWKPWIILDALEQVADGEWIVYADVGCSLNARARRVLRAYVAHAAPHAMPWFAFRTRHPLGRFTKRALLRHHGVDTDAFRAQAQLGSSVHVIRAEPATRALAALWHEAMAEAALVDDSRSNDEHPEFVEHRGESSVFTVLAWQHGVVSVPDQTRWAPIWHRRRDYPIHARGWEHWAPWPRWCLRTPWLERLLRRL